MSMCGEGHCKLGRGISDCDPSSLPPPRGVWLPGADQCGGAVRNHHFSLSDPPFDAALSSSILTFWLLYISNSRKTRSRCSAGIGRVSIVPVQKAAGRSCAEARRVASTTVLDTFASAGNGAAFSWLCETTSESTGLGSARRSLMREPLGICLVVSRNEKEAMPKLTVVAAATSATETT